MIHYTLLPEKEIKALKREYRTRLFIFFLFFMSCATFVGIGSLIPSYVFSYTQEKEAIGRLTVFEKGRQERGTDNLIKELIQSNSLIKRLKDQKDSVSFSNIILEILSYRSSDLSIRSFNISIPEKNASSTIMISLQGKSSTREALIRFKDRLSANPLITKVELPVSDLAKNKDISYSLKINLTSKP